MPEHNMNNYTGRKALLMDMLSDPELNISFKEAITYVYNWCRYELSIIKHDRACRSRRKYAIRLNQSKAVFALRKNIKDL